MTPEEKGMMEWIAEKCMRLDNPRIAFPYLYEKMGIPKDKFVELTNSREFLEVLDRYKMTFVYLPRMLEIKKKQINQAMRGDINAENALLRNLSDQDIVMERTDTIKVGMGQLARLLQRQVISVEGAVEALEDAESARQ